MSSHQVDANGFQVDSSFQQFLNFQLTSKSGTQVLKPNTPIVAADINTRVIERSNIIVDTTIRERPNDYDSLHETNVLRPKENT
ncbi:12156_t:CDS:2, partial [Funneliformis caledonium]